MSYARGGDNAVEYCSVEHLSDEQIVRLKELLSEQKISFSIGAIDKRAGGSGIKSLILTSSAPVIMPEGFVKETVEGAISKIEESEELFGLLHSEGFRYTEIKGGEKEIRSTLKKAGINNYTFKWLGDQKYLVLTGKNPSYQTNQEIGNDILETRKIIEQNKELQKLFNPQDLRTQVSFHIGKGIAAIQGACRSLKR